MPAATLGDLMRPASADLAAAARLPRPRPAADAMVMVTAQTSRVIVAISRYLSDAIPYNWYEQVARPDVEPWLQAAVDAHEALLMATDGLDAAARSLDTEGEPAPAASEPLAAHLSDAAAALAGGSDLLHSHFATGADGIMTAFTDWSAFISSVPFRRALLGQIARWVGQLSLVTARLMPVAVKDPAVPLPVRHALASTCYWLLAAEGSLGTAQSRSPAGAADLALLHAVPPNSPPERQPPAGNEAVSGLYDGLATSALRLRLIARQNSGGGLSWSHAATAESWRWTAKAAAVTFHISELMLSSIGPRAGRTTGQPGVGAQLNTAAAAAEAACNRWLEAAAAWDQITTETRGLDAPGIADASDLILRLGRLASGDPQWTPELSLRAGTRRPSDLARTRARLAVIVGAVHQAADALACTAAADHGVVAATARAGRLYAPRRPPPGAHRMRRPFGHADPASVSALLHAYRQAVTATTQAAAALDGAATTLGSPSRLLGAIRAAAARPALPGPHSGTRSSAEGARDRTGSGRRRILGPVEQDIRRLGGHDPVIRLHAAAIDQASRRLAAEAGQYSPQIRLLRAAAIDRAARRLAAEARQQSSRACDAGHARDGWRDQGPATAPRVAEHSPPRGSMAPAGSPGRAGRGTQAEPPNRLILPSPPHRPLSR